MKNATIDDKLVLRLFEALSEYLEESEPVLMPCRLNRGARKRQGFTFTPARHFIAVLEIPIRNRLEFVIFAIEMDWDFCVLKFCRPLRTDEYERLTVLDYVPRLRSKVHLSVGIGIGCGIPYAYSAIKMPQHSSMIALFDALPTLSVNFLNKSGKRRRRYAK